MHFTTSRAIGVSDPLSIYVDTHDTSAISDDDLIAKITDKIDLTPRGIRDHLNLHKPIYKKRIYGHFGRDSESDGSFSWEKTDLAKNSKYLFSFKRISVYSYKGRKISKYRSQNLINNTYNQFSIDESVIKYLNK